MDINSTNREAKVKLEMWGIKKGDIVITTYEDSVETPVNDFYLKYDNTRLELLQQDIGIAISIERDPRNTPTIKIEKNVSGVSCEYKITPETESLSPFLYSISRYFRL